MLEWKEAEQAKPSQDQQTLAEHIEEIRGWIDGELGGLRDRWTQEGTDRIHIYRQLLCKAKLLWFEQNPPIKREGVVEETDKANSKGADIARVVKESPTDIPEAIMLVSYVYDILEETDRPGQMIGVDNIIKAKCNSVRGEWILGNMRNAAIRAMEGATQGTDKANSKNPVQKRVGGEALNPAAIEAIAAGCKVYRQGETDSEYVAYIKDLAGDPESPAVWTTPKAEQDKHTLTNQHQQGDRSMPNNEGQSMQSEKAYVRNCLIVGRDRETIFELDGDYIHPQLDGYAIIPMEDYRRLKTQAKDAEWEAEVAEAEAQEQACLNDDDNL